MKEIWTPIQLQDVTLWDTEIPSFLLLLLNNPQLGSRVRKLDFKTKDANEEFSESTNVALELVSLGHPRLDPESMLNEGKSIMEELGYHQSRSSKTRRGTETQKFIDEMINFVRALILEQCTELTDLTFNSHMSFPFYIQRNLKSVISQDLQNLRMIELEYDYRGEGSEIPKFRGGNVLFLLLSLKRLKTSSFEFIFDHEDAEIINSNLSDLLESQERRSDLISNVEKIQLNVHLLLPRKRKSKHDFNVDETFTKFFSIFDSLIDMNFEFFDDEKEKKPLIRSYDVLKGLKPCYLSLTSLSVLGISEAVPTNFDSRVWEPRFQEIISILKSFRNLNHLRCGSPLLEMVRRGHQTSQASSKKSSSCPLPIKLESIELGFNYEIIDGVFKPSARELTRFVEEISDDLPKNFKLFKIHRKQKLPGKSEHGMIELSHNIFNHDEWDESRQVWHEACHKRWILTEFMSL